MRLLSRFICVAMLMAATPRAGASDLTDAMTSPDPRIKLQTGTGQAYHSRYGEPDEALAPADESELDLPGFEYQRSELYDRSPLDEPMDDLGDLEADDSAGEDLFGSGDLPPLGKEHSRPGVYYQDDLEHR